MIEESVCSDCEVEQGCNDLLLMHPFLIDIKTMVYGCTGYKRDECPIYQELEGEMRNG